MMRLPTLRRRALTRARRTLPSIAVLATAISLAECTQDAPTTPPRAAPAKPNPLVAATLGTLTIGVPTPQRLSTPSFAPLAGTWPTDGAQYFTSGITVPANTPFRVRVNGTIVVAKAPGNHWANESDFTMLGTYGPGGANTSELLVQVSAFWGSNRYDLSFPGIQHSTSAPDSSVSAIYVFQNPVTVYAGRTGVWGGRVSSIFNGHVSYDTLYQFTPSQTVTVETLTDLVHLTANPAYVKRGAQVSFPATREDGQTYVKVWHWQPDTMAAWSNILPCGTSNPCIRNTNESGMMRVFTDIGYADAHVTVFSNFSLDADHSNVNFGDTVTFTPKYDGIPGPAARWKFFPTDTATHETSKCDDGVSPCKKQMTVSGRMWAFSGQGDSDYKDVSVQLPTLTLYAANKYGPAGRTVVFTPRFSDGATITSAMWTWAPDTVPGSTAACVGSPPICQAVINNPGTMTVTVTRLGITFKQTAHVSVIQCPQNDSILDSEVTRESLAYVFQHNHGTDPLLRQEQASFIYLDTLTGEYIPIDDTNPTHGGPCWATFSLPRTDTIPILSHAKLIAIVHPHPLDPGKDTVPPHSVCNPKWAPGAPKVGMSDSDRVVSDRNHVPVFAVDWNNIYRTDGMNTADKTFPRTGTCTILPHLVFQRQPGNKPFFPLPQTKSPSGKPPILILESRKLQLRRRQS